MRKCLLFITLCVNLHLAAQDIPKDTTYWNFTGNGALTFSQVSLSDWQAGGQNSISGNALLVLTANYKKGNTSWDNTLTLGYGLNRQDDDFIKTDDRIDLDTRLGIKASEKWNYSAFLNFRTQFDDGFSDPDDSERISGFLAPAYLFFGVGMDYKPNKLLSLFLSPITTKITIVNDQTLANAGAFGVDPARLDAQGMIIEEGEKSRVEAGAYLNFLFKKELMENIDFQTKLDLYSNYAENPENIDVNWESLLIMKVNKYISVNFSMHLIYDDDIKIEIDNNEDGIIDERGPRTQFKQVLGAGLTYKF